MYLLIYVDLSQVIINIVKGEILWLKSHYWCCCRIFLYCELNSLLSSLPVERKISFTEKDVELMQQLIFYCVTSIYS